MQPLKRLSLPMKNNRPHFIQSMLVATYALLCLALLAPKPTTGQINVYNQIHRFGNTNANMTGAPGGPLIEGSDGAIYGASPIGGFYGAGTVFKMNSDGTDFVIIYSFSGADGRAPRGLTEGGDGALYGTTLGGGVNGRGVVYKVNKDGTGFELLHNFLSSGGSGSLPFHGLLKASDGMLYGTTSSGGTSNAGTVFKIGQDGTGYATVHNFSSLSGTPGPLTEGSDGMLYGTTPIGGSNNVGRVFKVGKDGTGFFVLHQFSTAGGDGQYPRGRLLEGSDGVLYGATELGGTNSGGTIYKMNKDGTGYAFLRKFSPDVGNDLRPLSGLIEGSDGRLYGTTGSGGGFNFDGTLFRVNKDGADYTVLKRFFREDGDGHIPAAELLEGSDGVLYGTTGSGGANEEGTIFRLNMDGAGYTLLWSFTSSGGDGRWPQTGLVAGTDGALYGTTSSGGNGLGTVFRLERDGTGYTILHSFSTASKDGKSPLGLIEGTDGILYGTTWLGGTNSSGTLFKLNKDGSGFTILRTLRNIIGEAFQPSSGLIEGSDGALYGTTEGAGGTVFKINKDGTGHVILHPFPYNPTPEDGRSPTSLLEGSDGVLYGTTAIGGSNNVGTVFKINKDGRGYMVLRHFTSVGGDGRHPYTALIESNDGVLYGTTYDGGSDGEGTIFRINKDGTGYLVLRSFSDSNNDGQHPRAALVEGSDGLFYGTTAYGGSGVGTVFRISKDGTGYSVFHSFSSSGGDGQSPWGGDLVRCSDGSLFGTTQNGGIAGLGTIYRLSHRFALLSPETLASGHFKFEVIGVSNLNYTVQRVQDLAEKWTHLGISTTGVDGRAQFIDTNPPPGRAFYRTTYP
jgi:uncharacterized repeat protein (TIGR03803 family)